MTAVRLESRCKSVRHVARVGRPGLLLAVWLLSMPGCERKGGPPPGAGGQRPPPAVAVAPAVMRDVPMYLDEIGKTLAIEVVSIVPQVSGKIVAAHVRDGDYVSKGQVLFEIDPRPFEAALAAAQATRAQNQADHELAQIEFNRTQDMFNKGTASRIEFDQNRVALAVAEAKVAAADASVQMAALNLEYTRILSPIDGRAGARLVDPGNVVKENDAPLEVIRRLDPIYVEFTVTDRELAQVRRYLAQRAPQSSGTSSEQGLPVLVDTEPIDAPARGQTPEPFAAVSQPSSAPREPREGLVTFLDNAVQGPTATVRLRATVPNADRRFWPGQFVRVRLVLATRKDAVLVPARAEQIGQLGPYVYTITPDGKAELRPITPGQRQGDLLVVERGLSNGERVVISGHMMVVPDAPVQVINGTPPQAPPGEALQPTSAPASG